MHHAWWMHGLCGGAPTKHVLVGQPHSLVHIGVDIDYLKGRTMIRGIAYVYPNSSPWGGVVIWGTKYKGPPHT